MKYLDLFTGIGGFTYGIEKALLDNKPETNELQAKRNLRSNNSNELQRTATCIGYSEIDKYASAIYSYHYPDHKNYGDITQINASELPDFDLLVGGFPCQAFSIAGKRRGFDDTRGTLFFDIARILKEKRPRNFILENVKGLLSHDDGRTFKTIIATLTELGYCVEWQVLNSKDFGVPQNRERVFIVGHLGGIPGRKVFPIGESTGKDIVQLNNPTHSNDRVYEQSGISPTLNTMQGGMRQPKIVRPVLTPDRPTKRQNGRRIKEDGEDSFTLTSHDKHGVMISNAVRSSGRIRRLTPTECERLQAFPDGWTKYGKFGDEVKEISDTQRYKCLGNTVTTSVITAIAKRLLSKE